MADSKLLEPLKASRTTAKRQFSRLVNDIVQMHDISSENELRDGFKKFTIEANKVMEANDDVEAQYFADAEVDADSDAVPVLSKQEKADVGRTASECEMKLKEMQDLIQKALWANFGEEELTMVVKATEEKVENALSSELSGNKEAFDFMLDYLKIWLKGHKSCTRSGSVGPLLLSRKTSSCVCEGLRRSFQS